MFRGRTTKQQHTTMYTPALTYLRKGVHGLSKHTAHNFHRSRNKKRSNEFFELNNILNYHEESSSSTPFMTTEHRTCFDMWVSSSLDTSASLGSKLLLCLWGFGDGDPENRLRGLENLAVGDPDSQLFVKTGTISFPVMMCLLSGFRGPRFVSNGNGFIGEVVVDGSFCLIRSRARSAAAIAFSLLILINVQGFIWMSSFFLVASVGSFSILIDSFRVLCHVWNGFVINKVTTVVWYYY